MGVRTAAASIRVGEPANQARLRGEIAAFREVIEKRRRQLDAAGDPPWVEAAANLLGKAEEMATLRKREIAWKLLHEARRQEVFGYAEEELEAAARGLKNEAASKLTGWRQLTVDELVTPVLDPKQPPDVAARRCRIAAAMRLRDESNDNRYFKLRLVQRQVALLIWCTIVLGAALAAAFVGYQSRVFPDGTTTVTINAAVTLVGVLLGALGACFSGLVSLVASSPDVSIPERIASTSVTLARPLIGAISALAGLLLLNAGLLNGLETTAIFVIAFAFGFSERLAIGALERINPR